MNNGTYNKSIVTVRPEDQPADALGEDLAGPVSTPDWEAGYAQWVDDVRRNDEAEAEFADELETYLATDLGAFE
jgi:hypothetical protein